MRITRRRSAAATTVAFVIVVQSLVAAAPAGAVPPTGPEYPPPGGVTVASSGNAGRAGGNTWSYSGFDFAAFRRLWWGPAGANAVKLALDGAVDEAGETLAFNLDASDLTGGVAVWTGASDLRFFASGGYQTQTLPTRFTLTVPDAALLDPTSVEIDPGAGAVHRVEGDYSANFIFEAFRSGAWHPVLDLYDSINTDPSISVVTSFSAGFWHHVPNRPPTATSQSVETEEDTPLGITLLATDPDEDPLTYTILSGPENGSLSGSGAEVTYTPDLDFNGTDAFTFVVSDGEFLSGEATVTIDVTPVNDPPVADAQSVQTDEDTPLGITLTGSDNDGDEITFAVVDAPANGSLAGEGDTLVYTPAADFNGSDAFTFLVDDGQDQSAPATVAITVRPINDAPRLGDDDATVKQYEVVSIDVLANDHDVEGDPLTIDAVSAPANGTATLEDDGTITYRPDPSFKDTDSFTYTVSDGNGGTSTATVTITEDGCGEDGPVSEVVDHDVESLIGSQDPYLAASVHDVNCSTVVPIEDEVGL